MQLTLQTWNGLNINDNNPYSSTIPVGQLVNLSAQGITVPRAAMFPFSAGKVLSSQNFIIRVVIKNQQSIPAYREILKAYFDITDFANHRLVALDAIGGQQWFLSATPIKLSEQSAGLYFITLQTESPIWQLVTPGSTNWTVTASGQTQNITPLGNIDSSPVFTITPTVAKSAGLSLGRWVPIYNPMDTIFKGALEITNGGLDTSALVGAGKMQADGDDFRVWLDGVETDRWLNAMNTAATKCWINFQLLPGKSATTSVSIAGAGAVTTISFVRSRNSLAFLQALGTVINNVVLIDNEAFLFTGVDLINYQLTGVTRTAKGTTIAAHAAPKTVYWIEHDVWLLYKDSALGAPDTDDKLKPMCDLSSTNGSLSFTNFFDADNLARAFSWAGEVNSTRTAISRVFTGPLNTNVDPSTELGLVMMNSADATVLQQETAQLDWIFQHSCGMTGVSYAGKKYSVSGSFPSIAGLQKLEPNSAWLTMQNENVPTMLSNWQAFVRTISLGGTYNTIRFTLDGSISQAAGDISAIQFDTVVVTVATANLPVIALGTELTINFFDFQLKNNTTTEYIKVTTPCLVGASMVIDCEQKLSYFTTGERVSVQFSSERVTWLDLLPSLNQLQYDDVGTNNVTVAISHRDRTM